MPVVQVIPCTVGEYLSTQSLTNIIKKQLKSNNIIINKSLLAVHLRALSSLLTRNKKPPAVRVVVYSVDTMKILSPSLHPSVFEAFS